MSESKLFTVDGTIDAIHRAPGVVNLLEDMQRGALFTGAVAAATDGLANFAGSTAVALYDGEDVEHIAMLVNGKLVIGTFQSTEDLNIGDQVRLVASYAPGDSLFAHAILRLEDAWLWMPYMHDETRKGMVRYTVKIYFILIIFLELLLNGLFYVWGALEKFNQEMRGILIFFEFVIMPVIIYLSSKDLIEKGKIVEEIFKVLGVARYKDFNVSKFSVKNQDFRIENTHRKYIIHLDRALAAHYKKYGIRQVP
ncbi:hypothetical protein [Chitinivorax sp. B]|uniref:hypothetical protein n=1 Tax=Chitinivorax sp. B TaxID=2502235 RepID=UPI0010F4ACED|nr:hypothetical protein [Chitinivorax sp. B]